MTYIFDTKMARQQIPDMLLNVSERRAHGPHLIAAGYAASFQKSFSGSSFFLTLAGIEKGVLDGGFTLYPHPRSDLQLTMKAVLWKMSCAIQGRKTGGFKFTKSLNDSLWSKYIHVLSGACLINNFQIYGDVFREKRRGYGIRSYFYIDGTLTEYFDSYRKYEVSRVDLHTMNAAIEIEKADYAAADGIIVMSRRSIESLDRDYGIKSERIRVIPPGANLPINLPPLNQRRRMPSDEFLLGFVGLYPERKGFNRLAGAVRILRRRNVAVRLRVIGRLPKQLKSGDGIDYLGIIDKSLEMPRFIQTVSSIDLGCQLSHAELTGIALCEYLRLGIPVLGTDVGGATDILELGGSVMVPADIREEDLADVLKAIIENPDLYARLKAEAESRRDWASWGRVAEALDDVV